MRIVILISLIIIGLLTSCYKVYDPHIDTAEKVLVVNGLITNQTNVYHVILTYARPFNSSEKSTPVTAANVYVTDDLGNSYIFNEMEKGDYISDSLQFTGIPGLSYRLHIVTPDGKEYESDSQRLFPEINPDSVYAEFDTKETLERYSGLKVYTHGADILIDLHNQSDTLPRFRITSNLVMEYSWIAYVQKNWGDDFIHFDFYCWKTVNANSNFNLTDEEYSLNSASIKKHQACFFDDYFYVFAMSYGLEVNWDDTAGTPTERSSQDFLIQHRILYLNQYTLNNETYLYYKRLNEQMQSEGKLFDPIAAQLIGNIKCISDPEKSAIGFFEASSVSNSEYIVDFHNLTNSQPALIKKPYILPPEPTGCRVDRLGDRSYDVPSFWIFI
jgi:hypothetical protein